MSGAKCFSGSSVVIRLWIAKPLRGISSCGGMSDLGAVDCVALGDEDLRADDVDVGDLLGDGVLDLHTRVHLDEEPLLGVHIEEELDGAGVVVADRFGDVHGSLAEPFAHGWVEPDRWGDLDHLLVAALHRAVALVQVDHVAMVVAEDLHLDVLGPADEALEEHGIIAKGIFRL